MTAASPFIYLATPCYGGRVMIHYVNAVLALQEACVARGVGLQVELMGGDAMIARARSRMLADFLAHPQATHLLFCDADIGFAPENMFRLLDSGKDVVGGVYPLKEIDWDKVRAAAKADVPDLMAASVGYVIRFIPTPDNSVEVDEGVAKVAYVGTGFMLISRDAARRVTQAYPQLRARLDGEPDEPPSEVTMVFDTLIEPETGQYLSEDYAFGLRWRSLGGEIWADVESPLTHVGHAAYAGSLMKAMRKG